MKLKDIIKCTDPDKLTAAQKMALIAFWAGEEAGTKYCSDAYRDAIAKVRSDIQKNALSQNCGKIS